MCNQGKAVFVCFYRREMGARVVLKCNYIYRGVHTHHYSQDLGLELGCWVYG